MALKDVAQYDTWDDTKEQDMIRCDGIQLNEYDEMWQCDMMWDSVIKDDKRDTTKYKATRLTDTIQFNVQYESMSHDG